MPSSPRLRDLILPSVVVAVVGMMVFPLPNVVLDVLLMWNIAFALALLISSVYLSEPEKFTSLPTILLLTTLFRLGLNISTTRQLLSQGEAPDIVVAFGEFVVSGNLIVGATIFIIVTLVQFLVIAKGAERVAEVAARFTLDAMPGKQMSIDADIRAGILSLHEAREKRRELNQESKLYGALDGAMKFVKGDAIAGLLITLINITAGLIVGVTTHGMSVLEALHTYTIFTIGDGLVSQIPALLVAVSAGICVTRVADKEQSLVGSEMFKQLAREPQALMTTAAVLGCMAMIPGLPAIPFLMGSGVIGMTAWRSREARQDDSRQNTERAFQPKVYSSLALRLSLDAARAVQLERTLPQAFQALRHLFFNEYGVVVPEIQLEIEPKLAGSVAQFLLNGVAVHAIDLAENSQSTSNSETDVSTHQSVTNKIHFMIEQTIRTYLVEIVDDTHTRMVLEAHHPAAEDLINSVVPALLSVTMLTGLLRSLLADDVSIRYMRPILQAIAEFYAKKDTKSDSGNVPDSQVPVSVELLADIRQALQRAVSDSLERVHGQVQAFTLHPLTDNLFSQLTLQSSPVSPSIVKSMLDELNELVIPTQGRGVILTSKWARQSLSHMLRNAFPRIRVISVHEICSELSVEVLGEVGQRLADLLKISTTGPERRPQLA